MCQRGWSAVKADMHTAVRADWNSPTDGNQTMRSDNML